MSSSVAAFHCGDPTPQSPYPSAKHGGERIELHSVKMLLVARTDLKGGAKGEASDVRSPPSSRAPIELIRNFRKLSRSHGSGVVAHAVPTVGQAELGAESR